MRGCCPKRFIPKRTKNTLNAGKGRGRGREFLYLNLYLYLPPREAK
jgi:hypothetical protein